MLRASGSWHTGFSGALDQGVVGVTQLSYRQANRPRVQAVIPYHTIPQGPSSARSPRSCPGKVDIWYKHTEQQKLCNIIRTVPKCLNFDKNLFSPFLIAQLSVSEGVRFPKEKSDSDVYLNARSMDLEQLKIGEVACPQMFV